MGHFFFVICLDADLIIANPLRLLEIMEENEGLVDLSTVNFLIVDEYIQFRKMQAMDNVKRLVEQLQVIFEINLFYKFLLHVVVVIVIKAL